MSDGLNVEFLPMSKSRVKGLEGCDWSEYRTSTPAPAAEMYGWLFDSDVALGEADRASLECEPETLRT
ncbi:hypothetical protein SAMN05445060_2786 [Williamsia sterculiae]|uniref:Uncharacterized protein n=1 Tax=Williamsia sterculiae TaxID=1344003 RepID=A0A1N7GH88_9NOCA|nr:hypothetical protein SAMN05445060_2786 [Williamsia sterculiae]